MPHSRYWVSLHDTYKSNTNYPGNYLGDTLILVSGQPKQSSPKTPSFVSTFIIAFPFMSYPHFSIIKKMAYILRKDLRKAVMAEGSDIDELVDVDEVINFLL